MAEPETVNITVNGLEMEARKGELVIAAAQRNGVYIPRFCYHPRLKSPAMCRMCLCEVKGPRGFALQPACYVPVAEGMEVLTDSPKAKKAQNGVLEFLLINHPLDCPVCDKGGNCPLQDHTMAFGPGESRFIEEKRHWEKPIWLSDLVHMDRERCIQCARCTRFADDVAGDPLIEFIGRGGETEVNTFPTEPFSSYFSGNTVEICPVGALLATPFRFRARPWDLEEVESTCTTCAVGCRTAVQSSTNQLVRYEGIDSDPVNHGWLCDRGRFDFEYVNSEQRFTAPLVAKVGAHGERELVEVSWGEALEAVASGLASALNQRGPAGVAVLGGARLANEDAYAWGKLARTVLGTDSVDAQLGDGLPAELVLGLPRATIDEAASASALVLLAPDLKEELPVLYLRLKAAAVEAGVPVVELSPQATGMSKYATVSLGYRPGEVADLARALVADRDPRGDVAGVPASAIATARTTIAGEDGGRPDGGRVVVVLGRPSLAESADLVAEAAGALAAGLGDRVSFLPALRRGNVHGALDMGLTPGMLPGRVSLDDGRQWFGDAWGSVPEQRGLDATGMLTAAAEGRLPALVLLGADPLADFPDRQLARRAVNGAGFIVAVDCLPNETNRVADVVLPAAAYGERHGTTTNQEGRITRLGQKVVAPGVAWPDWMIAVELGFQLGADLGFESIDDIWREVEQLSPAHGGITWEMLSAPEHRDGIVAPLGTDSADAPDAAVTEPGNVAPDADHGADVAEQIAEAGPTGGYPEGAGESGVTAAVDAGSNKREPASAGDDRAAVEGHQAQRRPKAFRYSAPSGGPAPKRDSYSVRLVTSRVLYDNGTLVQHSPSLRDLVREQRLRVNPYELERLGITTGEQMRVRSPRATLTFTVEADAGVPRGSAALWWNVGGEGAADLIDAGSPVTEFRLETLSDRGRAPQPVRVAGGGPSPTGVLAEPGPALAEPGPALAEPDPDLAEVEPAAPAVPEVAVQDDSGAVPVELVAGGADTQVSDAAVPDAQVSDAEDKAGSRSISDAPEPS